MEQIVTKIKKYEELEFSDDFMFGKVMEDKEICRDVLECLLQRPVGELSDIVPQKEFRYTSDGKPIRVDIYTRDENQIYDAEMQNKGRKSLENLELPKRSRFYQSSIDMDHLDKGNSYRTLPDSTVLFICTFDPFEKGMPIYTFRERCDEDSDIILENGAAKIFYNCTYKGSDLPDDLRELYDYMETGKSGDALTSRIDEAVHVARLKEEWRSAYMKEWVLYMDAKDEGREEGREEERANTERERKRADEAEAELAKYKSKFGDIV